MLFMSRQQSIYTQAARDLGKYFYHFFVTAEVNDQLVQEIAILGLTF